MMSHDVIKIRVEVVKVKRHHVVVRKSVERVGLMRF